jgi:hypothetical protein
MKKNRIILTAIVGVVLTLAGIYFRGASKPSELPVVASDVELSKQKLSDIIANAQLKSLKDDGLENAIPKPDESEVCSRVKKTVYENTVDSLVARMKSGDLTLEPSCLKDLPSGSKVYATEVYRLCTAEELQKEKNQCGNMLFFLKSIVAYENLKNRDPRSLSTEELVSTFFGAMDFSEYQQKVIDELQVRLPDSPFVAKAALLPGLLDTAQSGEMMDVINHLDRNIDRAVALNPNDKDLLAIEMMISVQKNDTNIESRLIAYNKANPKNGLGYYNLGVLAWNQKDRDRSLRYLKTALSLEPDNNVFKTTLEDAKSRTFDQNIGSIILGFDPRDI